MEHQVTDFFENLNNDIRETALSLHGFLTTFPEMQCKLRYKIPFYDRKSWICYISPLKKGGIELCFTRASELSNEQGLLEFKDRKQVAGITIAPGEHIPKDSLRELINEALILDEEVPYSARKKK